MDRMESFTSLDNTARSVPKKTAVSSMDSYGFFLDLMVSLDEAFLAVQGARAWHPERWGERFFQELSLNHPEWADQKLPIYMKACEILNYFAFLGRTEEMGPVFYEKPEALLRMVLMLFRHGESGPWAVGIREHVTVEDRGSAV
jgi:hypothetical protein